MRGLSRTGDWLFTASVLVYAVTFFLAIVTGPWYLASAELTHRHVANTPIPVVGWISVGAYVLAGIIAIGCAFLADLSSAKTPSKAPRWGDIVVIVVFAYPIIVALIAEEQTETFLKIVSHLP
jgi:hypothetical protein